MIAGDEYTYDVVIAGSGAAGLTAAITAAERGYSVLVLESTDRWGGTSAISGGGVWIPNNSFGKAKGLKDSREEALTHLKAIVGDHGAATSQARLEAYVDHSMTNPNLGKIEKAPFWAVRVYPNDIGAKGGVVTDEIGGACCATALLSRACLHRGTQRLR
ncbi:FAD-dependent oxidoreductase [Phyllobacterium sp. 22229]|uniref:FAD-dependent oxidoreductase n=1 Tax=Agrobacterium radiobacter TaxID=362 RepID=A0ABD5LPP5_AGRRD